MNLNLKLIVISTLIAVSTAATAARVEDGAQNQPPQAERMRNVLSATGTVDADSCGEGRPVTTERGIDSTSRVVARAACPNF